MFDIEELVKKIYEKIQSEFKSSFTNTLGGIEKVITDVDEETHKLVKTFGLW